MKILKIISGLVVVVAATICLFIPYLTIADVGLNIFDLVKNRGFDWDFVTIVLPFFLIYIGGILQICSFFKTKLHPFSFTILFLAGLFFAFAVPCYSNNFSAETVGVSVGSILLAIISFGASIISLMDLFESIKLTISDIVEIALFVSFAIVLQLPFLKIKIVATGGSISFTMIPLIILCMRKGFYKGFLATGIVFGLIDCMMDGYGFVTYPFDYLLGYGSLALVSLFNKFTKVEKPKIINFVFVGVGVIVGVFGRFCFSTISGMVLYNTSFVESMAYQLTYLGPSGAIALVGVLLLYKPLTLIDRKLKKN